MANQTCVFFGSDIAYDAMAPLWGINYTNAEGNSGKRVTSATISAPSSGWESM